MKIGDLQWARIPPCVSVARPEATRAAKDSRKSVIKSYVSWESDLTTEFETLPTSSTCGGFHARGNERSLRICTGRIARSQFERLRVADRCHQIDCARRSILTPAAVSLSDERKLFARPGVSDLSHQRKLLRSTHSCIRQRSSESAHAWANRSPTRSSLSTTMCK